MGSKRIAYRLCILSAAVTLGGAVALAQMPPGGQPPAGQQMPQQQRPGMSNQGTSAYPATAPTGQDFAEKAFVSKGLEGDQTEVELGQVAEQKSESNDVKQLARKIVADHSQMDEKWFKPLAKQLGVSEPKGPSKKDKKMTEKMQALSGPDFDTQYLTMMIKDHQKDLKNFQDEAKVAQNPNVKQVAEQGATVISQHLQLLEQVAKNHNIETGESAKPSSSM